MKLFESLSGWFRKLFSKGKRLFVLAWRNGAKNEALALINDEALQAAALACVKAAAAKALGGDAAFYDAYGNLKVRAIALGKDTARNILETILQVAYSTWKNSDE